MKRLLLVEDDQALGATLSERLRREGYTVRWSQTRAEAEEAVSHQHFDGAVVDIGLPDGNGLSVGRHPKVLGKIPLLYLTAMSSPECRLEAFELGAADYIPKPFHLQELLIRLKRLVPPEGASGVGVIDCGAFQLNLEGVSIEFSDGAVEFLPPREFQLLRELAESAPRVLSREEIGTRIWGPESNQRTVDNAVLKLRQLLSRTGKEWIRSVRGVGYQWVS